MSIFRGESTVDEIRERFDNDVERFSNLETGQSAAVDAPLALDLVSKAAHAATPHAVDLLDLGCGAGNFSLRLLTGPTSLQSVTLVDLSRPMLDRAEQRIREGHSVTVRTIQGDIRSASYDDQQYDVVLAAAVLHHLRKQDEWESVFRKVYHSLRTGGSFWIFDLVAYQSPSIQEMMWHRYGEYLTQLKDADYREHVQAYSAKEDSPRPLFDQLSLLQQVGFQKIDVLHANNGFAAFGAVK